MQSSEAKPRGKVFDIIDGCRVVPIGAKILVKLDIVEQMSAGGIITGTATEHGREQLGQDQGIVVSLGPLIHLDYDGIGDTPEERAKSFGYEVGDRVSFKRYEGDAPRVSGFEEHRLIDASCVLSKLESVDE